MYESTVEEFKKKLNDQKQDAMLSRVSNIKIKPKHPISAKKQKKDTSLQPNRKKSQKMAASPRGHKKSPPNAKKVSNKRKGS